MPPSSVSSYPVFFNSIGNPLEGIILRATFLICQGNCALVSSLSSELIPSNNNIICYNFPVLMGVTGLFEIYDIRMYVSVNFKHL